MRSIRGGRLVFKSSVTLNYNKNMDDVDLVHQYATTHCFIRKSLKWWKELFFKGSETSIINAYILQKSCTKKQYLKHMTNKQFRQILLLDLIDDFRVTSKIGRLSFSD